MAGNKKTPSGITIVLNGKEIGKITDWKPSRQEDRDAGFPKYVEKIKDVNKFLEEMWDKEIEVATGAPSFPEQSFTLKQDDCSITMILDGQETELEECWWEGDNFVVREKTTGKVWAFVNAYPVSEKVVEEV